MRKKLVIIVGLCVVVAAVGVALWFWWGGRQEDNFSPEPEVVVRTPVIVGVLLPETGSKQDVAVEMKAVLDLAKDEINRAGGVQGRDIILKYVDSGCDPDKTQSAMRELIDAAPAAIIGGVCRSESLVAARIAQGAGIPFISPAASAKEYSDIGNMVFRFVPSEFQEGEAAAAVAISATGTRAAVFACSQEYCQGLAKAFSAALSTKNIPLVSSGVIATSSEAIKAQLKALSVNKANFIYLPATIDEASPFISALQSSTLGAAIYLSHTQMGLLLHYATHTPIYELRLSQPNGAIILQKLAELGFTKTSLSQTAYRSYDILKKVADALTLSSVDNVRTAEVLSKISSWQGVADRYSIDPQSGDMAQHSIEPVLVPQKEQ